jgi:hypothetical protein
MQCSPKHEQIRVKDISSHKTALCSAVLSMNRLGLKISHRTRQLCACSAVLRKNRLGLKIKDSFIKDRLGLSQLQQCSPKHEQIRVKDISSHNSSMQCSPKDGQIRVKNISKQCSPEHEQIRVKNISSHKTALLYAVQS